MKFNKILMIFSLILVGLLCISSVSASEDENIYAEDLSSSEISSIDESSLKNVEPTSEKLTAGENSGVSNVIVVEEVEKNHNEMNDPTIQVAIDNAKAGDTIVINGESYVHCHFIVNKKLNIISNVGTTMEPCGSSAVSGYRGIFYITPEASGTVISGFNIVNDVSDNDYGILVRGASDVTIKDCSFSNSGRYSDAIRAENTNRILIQNVTISHVTNGIKIVNSQNVKVKNSLIDDSKYCINIIDSSKADLISNNITNNFIAGIAISGSSNNINIHSNNISEGNIGINMTAAKYVYILNNYIGFNKRYGVYTNCNITKMEIKGNFINQNAQYDIFNDHRVKNLFKKGGESLQVITNNYMIGHGDRPVWRQVYEYKPSIGEFIYDAANDDYIYVGEGKGEYIGHQSGTFLGYIFDVDQDLICPNIFFSYPTSGVTPWSHTGNYKLYLSEITQVKKGVYSISIVDVNGNIAKDISSVPVIFYLNKNNTNVSPQEGDTYKIVMMKNGTATVRFYPDDFNKTGNVLLASFPGKGNNLYSQMYRPYKKFAIDDKYIPGNVSGTKITVSDLNTYPVSNAYFKATLTDLDGNPIANEKLIFTINTRSYTVLTEGKGQAKLKIGLAKEKTYAMTVKYIGDGVDYSSSNAQAKVVIKKTPTKISSSNVYMIPKMAENFYITLKDGSNKPIANQKIVIKVNKKTYTLKTNSKGVAYKKLKFNKKGTYTINIKYSGSKKYKSFSKTNKIVVKYSSKGVKLTVPKVTIPPKTYKYYTISLKNLNGKGLAKQKVIVKLNGKKYSKVTNSKGNIVFKVKFSKIKSCSVSASYNGNKIYKKAHSDGKINVAKTPTKFAVSKVSSFPNEKKTYTVTLKTSSGKALSKMPVTMNVNGKTYSKVTNNKGQASLSLKFATEKTYPVTVKYNGNSIYKSSKATGSFIVSKINTQLMSYDKTFASDANKTFRVTLKDKSGKALVNEKIVFKFKNQTFTKATDKNGVAYVDIDSNIGSFDVSSKYAGTNKYRAVSKVNKITISNKTNVVFIDKNLPNSEIQNILNGCHDGDNVEFLGDFYSGISLNINSALNIYSLNTTTLNGKAKSPVFKILNSNTTICNLSIVGNSYDGIEINNASNVTINDNIISNKLDKSKNASYMDSTISLPGYGINIVDSRNIVILNNCIDSFESGIFAGNTNNLTISTNSLRKNNYGIKYGFGVANSIITGNNIADNIGLYTMLVPEGPRGYGVFLNNSAVNVTITKNNITWNHLGISVDANYSTGILITGNVITDNVLEGIRFNEGYDLAQNAVEPLVTDNAIYRNARGPSMMILGELSANPAGIYGPGAFNASLRLNIGPNWYGKNQIVTWDYETGIVGYGTMCPRISTTGIAFKEITCITPGTYSITFYKNEEVASNLPVFEMYAMLNDNHEIKFNVVNGVGTFSFDAQNFSEGANEIKISIGSLNDENRTFKVEMSKILESSEIPV